MIVCTPRPRVRCQSYGVAYSQVLQTAASYMYILCMCLYIYRYLIYIGLVLKRRNVGHGIVRLGKVGKVRTVIR